jgi:hypothetical protein
MRLATGVIRSLKMSTRREFMAASALAASSLASLGSNPVTAAADDPLTVFLSAVDAFNNRNWYGPPGSGALSTFLDSHVIAFTVHGDKPVAKIGPVIAYLINDVKKENPTFCLIGNPSVNGAVVTGVACWTDPSPVEVNYRFIVVNGKIVQMFAPEDGNPCSCP